MPKSIDELLSSPETGLPERSLRICLSQKTLARVYSLEAEKADLQVEADRGSGEDHKGPPKRASDGPDPRLAEIDAELETLYDVMREHTGEMLLCGVDQGTWSRWVDGHPPREENKRDDDAAYGYCNADDLIADLGTYAAAWNGDPLAPGAWARLAPKIAPGDIKELCRLVVQMHEVTGAVPKSRSASSASPRNESG